MSPRRGKIIIMGKILRHLQKLIQRIRNAESPCRKKNYDHGRNCSPSREDESLIPRIKNSEYQHRKSPSTIKELIRGIK